MKIKIGVVGCGRISKNHFDAIREEKRFELVAVCDIIEDRARKAGEEQNVPYFLELTEMLDSVKMDILSICTPSGVHSRHGVLAAKHKVHILTEKPMATRLNDADDLIQACDKNNVKLFVVKQNRLNATMQLLKNAVDKGRFGKIYQAAVNVFWQRPQEYYDMAKWRGTWDYSIPR